MPGGGFPFTTDRRAAERSDYCSAPTVTAEEGSAGWAVGILRARQCARHRQLVRGGLSDTDIEILGALVAPPRLQQTISGCVSGVESGSYSLLGASDPEKRRSLWRHVGDTSARQSFLALELTGPVGIPSESRAAPK
jgi:hypothetical protein